jgi:hypothetical protein
LYLVNVMKTQLSWPMQMLLDHNKCHSTTVRPLLVVDLTASGKSILIRGSSAASQGIPGYPRAVRASELLGSSQGKVKMTLESCAALCSPVQLWEALGVPRIFETGVLWDALGHPGVVLLL